MFCYMSYMTDEQEACWDCLAGLSGEEASRLLTNYHGNQLLDHGFYEYLIDEGYLPGEYEE